MDKTAAVLAERGVNYGDFTDQAELEQALMDTLVAGRNWNRLKPHQKSALQMICVKMARVVNGADPDYEDNWRDMAGYATLAADRCGGTSS